MNYKRNLRIGVDEYTDNETVLDVYGNINVSGNISAAGTVTYDDVTNVDAIGLVTARSGIDIGYPGTATTLTADGNAVFSGIVTAAQFFGDGSGLDGVTGVSIIAQEVTGDPVYPTFASNVGVTTLGIAQTGFVYVPSTGSVGIGSTQPIATLDVNGNVNVVGVLTAERLYSNVYGEFTGGGISGTNIVGTSLSISGISTLGTLQISSGIVTATSGIITYYGDASGLINTNFNGASKSVVKYIAGANQTTFVASYAIGYVDVYLNGVKLTADLYTATSGTSIVLNDGAAANDVIEIISFTFIEPSEADSANNVANKASSKYTATDGQTSFAATYEIGYVDVYLNGVKLTDDLYDATSGSAVILNDGAAVGDIVEIIAFTFNNFSGVGIATAGGTVGTGVTLFDFRGPGISTVTVSSGIATINIEGSSSGINPIVANIVF
jgi:hypothetical protein